MERCPQKPATTHDCKGGCISLPDVSRLDSIAIIEIKVF
jgi:hypothetical protein